MTLLEYAREVGGLPCRGFHGGRLFSWTADAVKVDAMIAAGASRQWASKRNRVEEAWEVSFAEGDEVLGDG